MEVFIFGVIGVVGAVVAIAVVIALWCLFKQYCLSSRKSYSSPEDGQRKRTLDDYGYKFSEDGRLCNIGEESKGFTFANQKHYDDIAELVEEFVYEELRTRCEMLRLPVPKDRSLHWSDSAFIFASRDYKERDKLLVLIHGSGKVRAGQWSRRLIINDSMESGSQIPYIQEATNKGYAVLVLNTNDNYRNGKPIKGSETPEMHARYVWENYIREAKCNYIAIVAHSYGGKVTTSLLSSFKEEFQQKVFAVAFTDASVWDYPDDCKCFNERSKNWVRSQSPLGTQISSSGLPCVSAGTTEHEETSSKAIHEVFNFIRERLQAEMRERKDSRDLGMKSGDENDPLLQ